MPETKSTYQPTNNSQDLRLYILYFRHRDQAMGVSVCKNEAQRLIIILLFFDFLQFYVIAHIL